MSRNSHFYPLLPFSWPFFCDNVGERLLKKLKSTPHALLTTMYINIIKD